MPRCPDGRSAKRTVSNSSIWTRPPWPPFSRGLMRASPRNFHAGLYSIADPRLYTLALADYFRSQGGVVERTNVTALRPVEGGVEVLGEGGGIRRGLQAVLSAGAFSHRIARSLGERIPLETERGYNTTLPADAFDLRTQVTFGGHGFVVTRLSTGIRIGGAVELGGLELPPNFRRSEAMLKRPGISFPD